MVRGRPRKHIRNTAGLRNQTTQSSVPQLPNAEWHLANDIEPGSARVLNDHGPSPSDKPERELGLHLDSTRFLINDDAGMESDSDVEEPSSGGDWEDKDLQEIMFKLAVNEGDDPSDEDWLPYELKKRKRPKIEGPKEYAKGPDVMSKSKRTQRRYRTANCNQKKLDIFGFSACAAATAVRVPGSSKSGTEDTVFDSELVTIRQECVEMEIPPAIREETVEVQIPAVISGSEESVEVVIPPAPGSDQEDENGWENGVDECVHGDEVDVRGWEVLREQIKKDMKKGGNTLPTTQINQLLVLRNFATLQLKGYGKVEASLEIARQWHEGEGKHYARKVRALVRHYQAFEQLPMEKREEKSIRITDPLES